jgi:hypothetical protein
LISDIVPLIAPAPVSEESPQPPILLLVAVVFFFFPFLFLGGGGGGGCLLALGVALQVEFERQILKPVFHLIGFRIWV